MLNPPEEATPGATLPSWIPAGMAPAAGPAPARLPASQRATAAAGAGARPRRGDAESPLKAIASALEREGLERELAARCAAVVCREFLGEAVYFPRRDLQAPDVMRDQYIRADRAAGCSWGVLAWRYGVSRSQARRICLREIPLRTSARAVPSFLETEQQFRAG